jgi:hypothetical protein
LQMRASWRPSPERCSTGSVSDLGL